MRLELWIIIGIVVAMLVWEFIMICPDKIPFIRNRRKRK